MLALIVKPVFLMLHRPEIDFSPGRKAPAVLGLVVPRRRICTFIKRLRPVLKLRQLRIRFPENYPPVASLIRLPECLRQKCVRLTSAGGTPVQSLILSPLHKLRLPFLRRPYHPPSAFYIIIFHLSNTSRFSVNLSPSPHICHPHNPPQTTSSLIRTHPHSPFSPRVSPQLLLRFPHRQPRRRPTRNRICSSARRSAPLCLASPAFQPF